MSVEREHAWRSTSLVVLTALLVLGPGRASAQDDAEARDAAASPPGLFGRVGQAVERKRERASEGFVGFVSSVDGYFGQDDETENSNESWARIRLDGVKSGGEDFELKPKVKVRIKLPQSEERFRLLLSSEDEEVSTVSADGGSRRTRLDSSGDQDVSLALRFIRTAKDTTKVNLDIGLRRRQGLYQVFGRINAAIEGEMVRYWTGRISNSFYYYARTGYENRLRFNVSRPLARKRNVWFRTSTAFDWQRGRKGAAIGQSIGFYGDLGERTAIALEALAGYSTAVIDDAKRYSGTEIRIRFRQSIWRPWFFYEVWPSVSWPATTDYDQVYGGLLRVEVLLGRQ